MAPTKRVTLADVAQRAGLSPSAVSMILNGRPHTRLSASAHERVLAAAKELGYRPNVAARGLRTNSTQTIGLISDHVATTRFASGLIRGALQEARAADHVVLVLETDGDVEQEDEAVAALLDRQVDGIVFATMRSREILVPIVPTGTGLVLLNASDSEGHASVLPDEYYGGRIASTALLDAGHHHGIALLGHNGAKERNVFRSTSVAERIRGIRDVLQERSVHLAAEESVWLWEAEGGYQAVRRLLTAVPDLQALICLNDRLAFGAYQALGEAGLRVGQDVSIVSFDDDDVARDLRPGLTTVALPHEAMGRIAVEALLESPARSEQHLVPMPLVVRGSVGAPSRHHAPA